ncbi:Serine carboxypeptidase-like 33 [Morella rubra]|uniref:Serine carboxypeptidase-like 33 n=1 Tax=Morella rubra TaxID=262757 RepID=A0A6A1VLM8_9ROSI|nr:Serine carboxypeptidase-like 33 [Morella rubra]
MGNPGSNKCLFLSLLSICLFLQPLITCIKGSEEFRKSQESDRVINLPGQPPSPSISHFSGYINVNKENGRALFYWFFEAQSQSSKKPLLLWLNGGPGCSSVGYGAAVELGPLRVNKKGAGLVYNKYAWNKEANLLFVESPVGVGFSYTNTSSDLTKLEDSFVGHYVPQLAELVYDRNKNSTKYPVINLKGFIVGNPETEESYDNRGILDYAWSHAVISDQLYNKARKVCDFKSFDWSNECNGAMEEVFENYAEIDIYDIYAPKCLINSTSSLAHSRGSVESLTEANNYGVRSRRTRIFGGYDPCFSTYAEEYFNRVDVQASLHASSTVKWKVCNDFIFGAYSFTVFSLLPVYTKLIKGGLKIWVYSGDADGRVPVIGSRYCVEALRLPLKAPWRSWYHHNQVGGRIEEYEGLTFVSVRGAGHLVPLDKPSEALSLIHSFLTGEPLPVQR